MIDVPMGCLSFCVFGDISVDFTLSIWLFFSHFDPFRNAHPLKDRPLRPDPVLSLPGVLFKKKKKDYSRNFDVFSVTANVCSESFSCLFFMCSMYYWSYVDLRDERIFSPLYVHEQITLAKITGRKRWRNQEEKYKSVGVYCGPLQTEWGKQ